MTPNQRMAGLRPVHEAVSACGTPVVAANGFGVTEALPALAAGTTKLLIS